MLILSVVVLVCHSMVSFSGWAAEYDSWEPQRHILDPQLIADYEERCAAHAGLVAEVVQVDTDVVEVDS